MKNPFITLIKLFLFAALSTLFALFSYNASAQSDQQATQYMYVCNQGSASVTVINSETHEIFETVDLQKLGFSENAKPHHAVAEPDGSYWYVTLIGENRVLKFSRDNELVDQAELEVPGLLALHPEEDLLYAGRSMSAVNPPQSFGVINRVNMAIMDEVDLFFTRPHALTTTDNGMWTFVGSLSENQILSINLEDDERNLTTIPGDTHTFVNFAVSPDGQTMVATGQVSGKLLFFDISDPLQPEIIHTIDVGAQPWHPVFSPDGKYVYFGNKQDHSVSIVNMENQSLEAKIKGVGLAQPHGAALTADGMYLYITNNNLDGTYRPDGASGGDFRGTVTVINTKTRSIEKVIEVGKYASGIGTNAW